MGIEISLTKENIFNKEKGLQSNRIKLLQLLLEQKLVTVGSK